MMDKGWWWFWHIWGYFGMIIWSSHFSLEVRFSWTNPPMFIVSNHRTILLGLLKSGGHHTIPGGFWAHNQLAFGRMIIHWNLRHFHKYISFTCEHYIYIYTRCVYNNNSNNNNNITIIIMMIIIIYQNENNVIIAIIIIIIMHINIYIYIAYITPKVIL